VVGRYSRTGEKLTDAKPKERRGKGGSMKAGEPASLLTARPPKFAVPSPSVINAIVPAGATTGSVEVTTASGTLSSNVPFQVK